MPVDEVEVDVEVAADEVDHEQQVPGSALALSADGHGKLRVSA